MTEGRQYYVYILASQRNGTLYIGVTHNLINRVNQHRNGIITDCFTDKYQVYSLVYFEIHSDVRLAINREKVLKRWNRSWKLELIEKYNPDWIDHYPLLWDMTFNNK